jgi:ABC-2 type transport system permease protein
MPIFDQGYQHWQGELSGHGWRWLAVARHGVRAQLQNRFVRLLLFFAWMPALALVAFLTLWGLLEQQAESVITFLQRLLPPEMVAQPRDYRTAVWTIAYTYFFKVELFCSLVLVMIVGPNLVSRDLRFNALPLYLSRPVRRIDYFLGKLGVIGFFLAAIVIVPAIGAYALGVAFSLDLGVIRDTHHLLWGGILYGVVITFASGTLMLALSALSRRSIYVGIAWAGLIFLSHMLSSALRGINDDIERRQIVRDDIAEWVKDHPAPKGTEMSGPYPMGPWPNPRRNVKGEREPELTREEKARERWFEGWRKAFDEANAKAEAARAARSYTDWRPMLSFANNLDRLGDFLLDADGAWELIGRTIERPRQLMGPFAKGRNVPISTAGSINDRRLAERMVWQFPWYWSAAVLGGVCLLSAFVLSRRVKSLDRLK